MSFDAEKLYALLPAIYRLRDAEQGEPLRALLEVIAGQVGLVQENLDQLYDDQFIETCAEWVVPYLGDLIGYRALHGVAPRVVSARAEVGHTIAFRRRKGTAAMLEQLARDVTGWDARAVEFFLLLGWTQHMNHVRADHWYAPDLRRWEDLERLGTPFEKAAHTVDVRHIAAGDGRYNIPNVGLFLWRIRDYRLTDSRAFHVGPGRWRFGPRNVDAPLFTRAESEDEITHLAEPINVPLPISRRVLAAHRDRYYGAEKSIFLTLDGVGVPREKICSCDLSDAGAAWANLPDELIAIDPVLGRIAVPPTMDPERVTVRFCYGFSADMGGGEYERGATFAADLVAFPNVVSPPLLQPALDAALTSLAALPATAAGGSLSIEDSGRYDDALTPFTVPAGRQFELRAGDQRRPALLRGGDLPVSGEWELRGGADSVLILNGLLLSGHTLRVPAAGNQLAKLILRHCTLVPGALPSLIVEAGAVQVEIDHCIIGGVRVSENSRLHAADSILDATSESAIVYAAPGAVAAVAGGAVRIERCTVIGQVHTLAMELASNSIFLAELGPGDAWGAPIISARKQQGCVRFSHVPLSAVVPRRFHCQPVNAADALRVRPQFTSLRYGDPGYGQLRSRCAIEIRQGADDEAEMGAFHDLFQPQREINLRVRLEEYLRFRLEAGILDAT